MSLKARIPELISGGRKPFLLSMFDTGNNFLDKRVTQSFGHSWGVTDHVNDVV